MKVCASLTWDAAPRLVPIAGLMVVKSPHLDRSTLSRNCSVGAQPLDRCVHYHCIHEICPILHRLLGHCFVSKRCAKTGPMKPRICITELNPSRKLKAWCFSEFEDNSGDLTPFFVPLLIPLSSLPVDNIIKSRFGNVPRDRLNWLNFA